MQWGVGGDSVGQWGWCAPGSACASLASSVHALPTSHSEH